MQYSIAQYSKVSGVFSVSPTASLSSSVDTAEYRITLSRSFSPSRGGVLPSFFKSKSVETIASPYEYKLALNVNSSTFGLVIQIGFQTHFSSEKHANATHAHSPNVRALPTQKPMSQWTEATEVG